MLDLVRDSTFGQLVNWASSGRLLQYPDQRDDYVVPSKYLRRGSTATNGPFHSDSAFPRTLSEAPTLASGPETLGGDDLDLEKHLEPVGGAHDAQSPSARYEWLVDWEENDSDRPLCVLPLSSSH